MHEQTGLKFNENITFELGNLLMEKNKLLAEVEVLTAENKRLKDQLEKEMSDRE